MRLLIDVRIETWGGGHRVETFETTVYVVERSITKGVASEEIVLVDAYIPPPYRKGISQRLHTWRSSSVLRCSARVAPNRKTLTPFMTSGEQRWTCKEAGK